MYPIVKTYTLNVSMNIITEYIVHYISFQIYWSNVLTERFSILYKNQTKEDTSF